MNVSRIGSFIRIKTSGVSALLFLRGMRFFSGATIAKIDPNPVKTEKSKFSLGIIISRVFGIFSNFEIY